MRRVNIFVTGRVQGVGFRYYCLQSAEKHDINGWVKNLNDGSVEILAEGDEVSVLSFIRNIKDGSLGKNITKLDIKDETYEGSFSSFEIRL